MKDKFIDAGGIKTHYYEEGRGPSVILIHGGGAGADAFGNWRGSIPLFAEHFRVFAVDMLGFGQTDKPDPGKFVYSQETRTRHIASFIEALNVGKVNLVGNSMGGMTSLCVTMTRPELVEKLVLMGAAGIKAPLNESLRVIMGYSPTRENMVKLIKALTNDDFKVDPELVEYRLKLTMEPATSAAYGGIMKWIGEQGGLYIPNESDIAKVKHKTLIVGGKNDKVVPPESNWRFSQLLENSWLHLIPGCGHWAMIERPQEFSAVTSWFINHA
jgi:2-hydroxy-6-oxo-6-(2'-aminophenyl)hexa-2,4-dienoate hydrolase